MNTLISLLIWIVLFLLIYLLVEMIMKKLNVPPATQEIIKAIILIMALVLVLAFSFGRRDLLPVIPFE